LTCSSIHDQIAWLFFAFTKVPFGVTKTCCNHGNQGQQDIEKHENVMDVYVKCFQKDHVKTQSIVSNKQINNKFEQMKR
jgi:hypothetical protein